MARYACSHLVEVVSQLVMASYPLTMRAPDNGMIAQPVTWLLASWTGTKGRVYGGP